MARSKSGQARRRTLIRQRKRRQLKRVKTRIAETIQSSKAAT